MKTFLHYIRTIAIIALCLISLYAFVDSQYLHAQQQPNPEQVIGRLHAEIGALYDSLVTQQDTIQQLRSQVTALQAENKQLKESSTQPQ